MKLTYQKPVIELTEEELQAIKTTQELLSQFELNSTSEDREVLEDLYTDTVSFSKSAYALPTAIDFLDLIIRLGEVK